MEREYGDSHLLVVVDMQNDFVTGSLGSKDAEAIVPAAAALIRRFGPARVVFTMDTHGEDYLETFEGVRLPVKHCIHGTAGWALADKIKAAAADGQLGAPTLVEKQTFGSTVLADMLHVFVGSHGIDTLHICGLCTDICVVSNALILRAVLPRTRIVCHADCCAGTSREAHEAALTVMRSCQIDVVGEEEEA